MNLIQEIGKATDRADRSPRTQFHGGPITCTDSTCLRAGKEHAHYGTLFTVTIAQNGSLYVDGIPVRNNTRKR